jgi:uncharacterized repeat protein (TIGR02543 family)
MHAQWTAITYSVSYNSNGGGGTTPASVHTYDVEKALTANGFTRTDYDFAGWNTAPDGTGANYDNGESVINLSSVKDDTVTLHAQWTAVSYDIVYHLDGGTNAETNPETYTIESEDITLDNPARAGYAFGGWYSDAAFSGAVTEIPAGSMGDKTFYARWQHEAAINISVWINEDRNILVSNNDVTISKTGGPGMDRPTSFSARVWETYANIQWELNGAPIGDAEGTARDFSFYAADYDYGTYILGVTVTRNGIPYSTDIRFTVTN